MFNNKKRKSLICPVCRFPRLIDVADDNLSECRVESKVTADWKPDYYQKCYRCHKQIAIRKIS